MIHTFHSAHNYGSMLQAYALQKIVSTMGFRCEIIDFRTSRQTDKYALKFKTGRGLTRLKYLLSYLPEIFNINKKHSLFEDFINKVPHTKERYLTCQSLEEAQLNYDFFISGSDQIWNVSCDDFDWAFFLPFVKTGKRIAYAPSMGPAPFLHVTDLNVKLIRDHLKKYDHISVREIETAQRIGTLGKGMLPVALDPTLLLPPSDWEKLAGDSPIIKGEYILLYVPFYREEVYEFAYKLSQQYNLKVVVTQFYGIRNKRKWNSFVYYCAVGPKEFLNLCKFATIVCGYSFHLVAFAVLFKTTFAVLNIDQDSRVAGLLSIIGGDNITVKDGVLYKIANDTNLKLAINNSLTLLGYYLQK